MFERLETLILVRRFFSSSILCKITELCTTYISKKKDDDKGLSRVLKGDKCEIAQRESFRVGSSLGKNDLRQQRLYTQPIY